jgi:hypothetical protein
MWIIMMKNQDLLITLIDMISELFLELENRKAKIKATSCIIHRAGKDLDKDNFKEV